MFSNKSSYAGKLLDEAGKHLKQRQYYFQKDNDESIEKECLEIIRLCQLSIAANPLMGDAYVLLADSLLLLSLQVTVQINTDSYEFFTAAGAAVISKWQTFPNERYSSSEGKYLGERLWRVIIVELMHYREQSEQDVIAYVDLARCQMADTIISPTFFQAIQTRLATANRDIAPLYRKFARLLAFAWLGELNADELIGEIGDSMQMAKDGSQQLLSQDDMGSLVQWWSIFLNQWGGKCLNRWSVISYGLTDHKKAQTLWFDYFEPLWLVGCEIAKIDQLKGFNNGLQSFVSGVSHPVSPESINGLNKWAQGLEPVLDHHIEGAKNALRQTITSGLKKFR